MAEITLINVITKECLETDALNQASKECDMDAKIVLLKHGSSSNQRYNNEINVLRQRLPTSRLNYSSKNMESVDTNIKKETEQSGSLFVSKTNDSIITENKVDIYKKGIDTI